MTGLVAAQPPPASSSGASSAAAAVPDAVASPAAGFDATSKAICAARGLGPLLALLGSPEETLDPSLMSARDVKGEGGASQSSAAASKRREMMREAAEVSIGVLRHVVSTQAGNAAFHSGIREIGGAAIVAPLVRAMLRSGLKSLTAIESSQILVSVLAGDSEGRAASAALDAMLAASKAPGFDGQGWSLAFPELRERLHPTVHEKLRRGVKGAVNSSMGSGLNAFRHAMALGAAAEVPQADLERAHEEFKEAESKRSRDRLLRAAEAESKRVDEQPPHLQVQGGRSGGGASLPPKAAVPRLSRDAVASMRSGDAPSSASMTSARSTARGRASDSARAGLGNDATQRPALAAAKSVGSTVFTPAAANSMAASVDAASAGGNMSAAPNCHAVALSSPSRESTGTRGDAADPAELAPAHAGAGPPPPGNCRNGASLFSRPHSCASSAPDERRPNALAGMYDHGPNAGPDRGPTTLSPTQATLSPTQVRLSPTRVHLSPTRGAYSPGKLSGGHKSPMLLIADAVIADATAVLGAVGNAVRGYFNKQHVTTVTPAPVGTDVNAAQGHSATSASPMRSHGYRRSCDTNYSSCGDSTQLPLPSTRRQAIATIRSLRMESDHAAAWTS